MIIKTTKKFKKQIASQPIKTKEQFKQRVALLIDDPDNPTIRRHALKGEYAGYWSINVSGDLRALYFKSNDNTITFGYIGTHSELYGK